MLLPSIFFNPISSRLPALTSHIEQKEIGLMLDFDLSRRTSLYLRGTYQHVVSAHTGTAFDFAGAVCGTATRASG